MALEKQCPQCVKIGVGPKPTTEFHKSRSKEHGVSSWCKACEKRADAERKARDPRKYNDLKNAASRKWRVENSERAKDNYARHEAKRRGMPLPTREMPERCECCGADPGQTRLHRDHCHTQGIFRGWICRTCNPAAGYLKDNPTRADKLAAYLRRFLKDTSPSLS